jgi:hypothetical protein
VLRRISAQHGKNEHALKLGRKGQKIDLHKESAPKKIECENAAYTRAIKQQAGVALSICVLRL